MAGFGNKVIEIYLNNGNIVVRLILFCVIGDVFKIFILWSAKQRIKRYRFFVVADFFQEALDERDDNVA